MASTLLTGTCCVHGCLLQDNDKKMLAELVAEQLALLEGNDKLDAQIARESILSTAERAKKEKVWTKANEVCAAASI